MNEEGNETVCGGSGRVQLIGRRRRDPSVVL